MESKEPPETLDKTLVLSRKSRMLRVAYLGMCFTFLFIAFGPTQSLMTTLHDKMGFVSLALLYLVFSVGSLAAPAVCLRLGLRLSLVVAAATYVLYVFCAIPSHPAPILIASVCIGFGAGMLWVGQGLYVSRIVCLGPVGDEARAKDASTLFGIFAGIFCASQFTGNLLSGAILQAGVSAEIVLVILGCIGGASIIMFMFVRRADPTSEQAAVSFRAAFVNVWKTMREKRTRFIYPIMFSAGWNIALTVGPLPLLVDEKVVTFLFVGYGVLRTIGSFTAGALLSRFHWASVVIPMLIMVVGTPAMLLIAYGLEKNSPIAFISAAILGAADGCYEVLISTSLIRYWGKGMAPAAGLFRCVTAGAAFLGFVFGGYLGGVTVCILSMVLVVIASVCYWGLDRHMARHGPSYPGFLVSITPGETATKTEPTAEPAVANLPSSLGTRAEEEGGAANAEAPAGKTTLEGSQKGDVAALPARLGQRHAPAGGGGTVEQDEEEEEEEESGEGSDVVLPDLPQRLGPRSPAR